MMKRLNLLHLLALILFLFMGVAIMRAEQLRGFHGHLQQALADVEVAKQELRQQLDALREKENQCQQALSRTDTASTEALMSAEQLRVLDARLRDALIGAEAVKSRMSKLLAEAEHAKKRLVAAVEEAARAKKKAEEVWAIDRQRRELLDLENKDSKEDLQ